MRIRGLFTSRKCKQNLAVTVSAEVATYFNESLLPINHNPLTWWQMNEHHLPTLAQLAPVYLSSPPSSVQSEFTALLEKSTMTTEADCWQRTQTD